MYRLLRSILFLLPPEQAHHTSLALFRIGLKLPLISGIIRRLFKPQDAKLGKKVLGLSFPNPVGLAAGFDKDGKYVDLMDALGFGFIEIGTVTPKPQAGNPQPRLFRLPEDKAIINRMGFNNDGVDALVGRLKAMDRSKIRAIIGGNIGKNKVTPNESAHEDYRICFEALHPYVDYFVVNVSSPNTPGLRALQGRDSLELILRTVIETPCQQEVRKPILLKIAPDLTQEAIEEIAELINSLDVDGLIVSNTTISRAGLSTADTTIAEIGAGGLSGRPVKILSDQALQTARKTLSTDKSLIAVGGVFTGADAKEKLDLGADLVQVYTGFIYEGPAMVKNICKTLSS